jgi:two-component system, cell cycle response regulator
MDSHTTSRRTSSSRPKAAQPEPHGERPHGTSIPLRVLVAEDGEAERAALTAGVRALGYECEVAADGNQAWDMFRRTAPDVILSDWAMPGLSGFELCHRVRKADGAHNRGRYTFFVIVSGHHDREHVLQGLSAGADDYIAKPIDVEELQARLKGAERLIGAQRRLEAEVAILRDDRRHMHATARLDELTGIANRRQLDEDLEAAVQRVARYREALAVAMIDIDHFKRVNDVLGHQVGDEVLRSVSAAIAGSLRRGDTVYRYGGEEFAILLPHQKLEGARAAVERVRAAVENAGIPHPDGVVTVSAGVALAVNATPAEWIAAADRALYRAKDEGRNRVVVAP